jgi:hypothetical protein
MLATTHVRVVLIFFSLVKMYINLNKIPYSGNLKDKEKKENKPTETGFYRFFEISGYIKTKNQTDQF